MLAYLPVILSAACLFLLVVLLFRKRSKGNDALLGHEIRQVLDAESRELAQRLREEMAVNGKQAREELATSFMNFQLMLGERMAENARVQNSQLTEFSRMLQSLTASNAELFDRIRQNLVDMAARARTEQKESLEGFSRSQQETIGSLIESNEKRLLEIRQVLEAKITSLQQDNAQKLEEMRRVVDEKLHATLEQRLGESFRLVSERLERVHQGLGEMHQLATGVGDLKRVLTNVKTRGTWGEVQLGMLLEQVLVPEQYGTNVETIAGSGAYVEYAIRLPGKELDAEPVWLPVDAKFPKEQYERLVEASERGDAEAVAQAGRELERAVITQARTIHEKYVSPPKTTDFALMFLPTEGLYAEVMRRTGLSEEVQRKYRISIAGPSTLLALLNSLQMGFRTMVLEKRSSEVWEVLGAVKTEFAKFGNALETTKKALERAAKNIDETQTRTRQMTRKLRDVETAPDAVATRLFDQGEVQ